MSAGRSVKSASQAWGTPKKYVDAITTFFNGEIALDPCSNEHSIVHAKTEFLLPTDGLTEEWDYPTVFVNPPYGRDYERGTTIKDWIAKCYNTHQKYGNEVIALIPVATNTSHWKEYIFGKADTICFLYDTRLKFLVDGKDGGKGAPMACCLVYWGNRKEQFHEVFGTYGATINL